MTRYAVGDIQGCLKPLQCLLEQVSFNTDADQLWVVGDLINRGPDSLETLRFIKQLGESARVVLGNHDLHFLAVAFGAAKAGKSDTFEAILAANDCDALCQWLAHQPLLYSDPCGDYHMVHAGIPPVWSLTQAASYAREVEAVLSSEDPTPYLQNMYGNTPARWDETLEGWPRLRAITNYFTRLRFCKADGTLEFKHKLAKLPEKGYEQHAPWFSHPQRLTRNDKIIFGHWAALQGKADTDNIYALDTGCVWGHTMTLMNLDEEKLHSCSCQP